MSCDCDFDSSACIVHSGDGSAGSPFAFEFVFDPDPDNLLSCTDGLLLQLPTLLEDPPRTRVSNDLGVANVANSTDVQLPFNRELWDTANEHDNTTNNTRLTASEDGLYLIIGMASWTNNEANTRRLRILHNVHGEIGRMEQDAIDDPDFAGVPERLVHQVMAVWPMEQGQYVECNVRQNSGVLLKVHHTPNYAFQFMWQRLGPIPVTGS